MLIEAWFANLDERSTIKNVEKVKIDRGSGFDLLEKLHDISLRVAFGQIIAERNKLKKELEDLDVPDLSGDKDLPLQKVLESNWFFS